MGRCSTLRHPRRLVRQSQMHSITAADPDRAVRRAAGFPPEDLRPERRTVYIGGAPRGRGPVSMAAEGAAARRVRLAAKAGRPVLWLPEAEVVPAKTLRRRAKQRARAGQPTDNSRGESHNPTLPT